MKLLTICSLFMFFSCASYKKCCSTQKCSKESCSVKKSSKKACGSESCKKVH